jgi:5-methylcytosine-specific restriction endonuclease McrA
MPGNWEGSDRKSQLPNDWPAIVAAVKKRDEHRCRWILPSGKRCPRPGRDVDHIKDRHDHSMGNLQLLCEEHHAKKSSREGNTERRRKKQVRLRDPGRHPGTIG